MDVGNSYVGDSWLLKVLKLILNNYLINRPFVHPILSKSEHMFFNSMKEKQNKMRIICHF